MHGEALREAVHALQESPGYRPGDYARRSPSSTRPVSCRSTTTPGCSSRPASTARGSRTWSTSRPSRSTGPSSRSLDDSAAAEVLRWRRCSPRTDPLVGPRDGSRACRSVAVSRTYRRSSSPGGRVLLRPRPSRPALAGRSHHVTVEGDAITTVEPARIRRQRRRGDLRRRALTAPRSGGLRGDLSRVAPVVRRGPGTSPEPR